MKRVLLGLLFCLWAIPAVAQTTVVPCTLTAALTNCERLSGATPLAVTGNTNIPTYSAAADIANTGAGIVYCIQGSATKVVRVKGIRISAFASAALVTDTNINRYSTGPSGGVAVTGTIVPNDTNNAAATAVVTSYTTSPTAGNLVGTVRHQHIAAGTQGNTAQSDVALYQFSVYWDQPMVLRGTSQYLCVNNGALGTGGVWTVDHEHTEQDQ